MLWTLELAGGEGGGDLFEGEVVGGAAGALLPLQEERSVAVGHAGGAVDLELGEDALDPVGGAFEFGEDADGGFVDDEVGAEVLAGEGLGPLGAELLVDEGGGVAELAEDLGEGGAVADEAFSLDAGLVLGVVGILGHALVGEDAEVTVAAEAKDLAALAQIAPGRVVKGVVLKGAGCLEGEAELGETGLELLGVGDGELHFDLGTLHGEKYMRACP